MSSSSCPEDNRLKRRTGRIQITHRPHQLPEITTLDWQEWEEEEIMITIN
jgi:hypothetical protein